MSQADVFIDQHTPIETIQDLFRANVGYEAKDDLAMCERFIEACGSLMLDMHKEMGHGSEQLTTNSADIPGEKHRAEQWARHKRRKHGRHLFSTKRWRQF